MLFISKHNLEEIKEKFLSELAKGTYMSKTIQGDFIANRGHVIEYDFIIDAVLYRDENNNLTDIVPVWWEFHTFEDGRVISNDFYFSDLKKLIF